jgi:hypothetical protein
METLRGFPNLPAMVRAEQSSAAPHAFVMETLRGFPNLPAMGLCLPNAVCPPLSRAARQLNDLDSFVPNEKTV